MTSWLSEHRSRILATFALIALTVGGALHLAEAGHAGDRVWAVATAILAAELLGEVIPVNAR